MPTPLFVTGTDTAVGKTHVTRALARLCTRAGLAIAPLKLVETGCHVGPGSTLFSEDGAALAAAAHRTHALDVIAPLRFRLAASPAHAARDAGVVLTLDRLDAAVQAARALGGHLLVEGAGGFLAPLTDTLLTGDFARHLGARVLVVARDALGTLNHTLLTVEAVRARGLDVAAVVLDAVSAVPCALDHAATLRALLPHVPVFGPLPWTPGVSDDGRAEALANAGVTVAIARAWFGA